MEKFDYLVLGAGSGGIASARRAAQHGARVAVIEEARLGGTCVNVGCVPKKVMWNASFIRECLQLAPSYGFEASHSLQWPKLKASRDAYIKRLNGIYEKNLDKSGVTLIQGHGRFIARDQVEVNGKTYTAPHILIATGSEPFVPNIPGAQHTSNDFFEQESLPKKVVVVGGGYIGVELAGVLSGLGSEVSLLIRGDKPLRGFDGFIREGLAEALGPMLRPNTEVERIEGSTVHLKGGETIQGVDLTLFATGRTPRTKDLGLEEVGIKLNDSGAIQTDESENTSVPGIYAVGDVNGKIELTPVAIAAGRKLAERLFNQGTAVQDYTFVPTVVFSHPPVGTVGFTEEEARTQFSEVTTHTTRFTNMFYSLGEHKPATLMKMVCEGPSERVVGLHMMGLGCDEMIQGFGVAVKMGATREQFHATVPIHPTGAEEVVLL